MNSLEITERKFSRETAIKILQIFPSHLHKSMLIDKNKRRKSSKIDTTRKFREKKITTNTKFVKISKMKSHVKIPLTGISNGINLIDATNVITMWFTVVVRSS